MCIRDRSGSLLGLLVLAGYVLLVEDNQWLRLSAVKAVAVYPVSYTHLDVYKRQEYQSVRRSIAL